MESGTWSRGDVWGWLAVLGAGGTGLLGALLLGGAYGPAVTAIAAAGALWAGIRIGDRRRARAVQMHLYRVADELVQYRAFTRLLRSQGQRIIDLSGESAIAIAEGLRDMDERAARCAERLETMDEAADARELRAEVHAITAPIVDMVGRLQFQDVTRQQLMFLSRLSLLLDDHIGELCRVLGDRRSLERTTRFKELFDAALDETVMASQRNDHHDAAAVALFEQSGPAIEIFADDGGKS